MSLAALGSTTDSTMLVDGSVSTVLRDADDLVTQAENLESVAGTVDRRAISDWAGIAADEYASRRSELRDQLASVAWVYRLAADALRSYADVLSWGQGQASVAIELWATGTALTNAYVRETGARARSFSVSGTLWRATSGADPGLAAKQQAEVVLADARSVVAAAGRSVAALLDQVSEGMPDGRWHAGSFAAGIWSWISGLAGTAWEFSLLRVVIDPDGAARSALAVWDSTTATYRLVTSDPLGAPDVLLDGETRRDDPARWWGQLAPDIALTAAGGTGLASRAASGFLAGARADVIAERLTVGRTGFTAEELTTPSAGDGPVPFRFRQDWDDAQVSDAVEHIDMLNAARLEGHLSESGRVSTDGVLRRQASLAAELERARAELAGTPYQKEVGHVPDTTWTGNPQSPYWQDLDSSVNRSFGGQAPQYPVGYKPTIFEGRLPDGTLVRGSWDWRPE